MKFDELKKGAKYYLDFRESKSSFYKGLGEFTGKTLYNFPIFDVKGVLYCLDKEDIIFELPNVTALEERIDQLEQLLIRLTGAQI